MKLVMDETQQANLIKISAVITAMPRWVAALLASEGLVVPVEWKSWWVVASAIMGAGMAVIEGWAFAFIFTAWRNQKDARANKLLVLALISGVLFIAVAAPNVAASVRGVPLGEILANDWMLAGWSVSVIGATISIVASVGYAQKNIGVPTVPLKSNSTPSTPALASASVTVSRVPDAHSIPLGELPAPEQHNDTPALPTGMSANVVGKRGTVEEYLAWQDGKELADAASIMAQFHVPKRTAYNWRSKHKNSKK